MNRVLNFVVVAATALIIANSKADAAVVNITEGSTNGYTMTDGNTYVIQNSVEFSNSTAGGSGMTVANNATVVIYVPTNVTLTAIGANGSGRTGGGAGICVPESATLIITGEGTVNATGGNAGNGENGTDGLIGSLQIKYDGGYKAIGSSGIGGSGGDGGGGSGAGIGGVGGCGGIGGVGGIMRSASSYVNYLNFCADGNTGAKGESGCLGMTMGSCYVIGSIVAIANSGYAGSAGDLGSAADWVKKDVYPYYIEFAACGGGTGGGGGAGSSPTYTIGGGGASGGGGGGGGSGALIAGDSSYVVNIKIRNACGGGGIGGKSSNVDGSSGTERGLSLGGHFKGDNSDKLYYGGDGGVGGAAGAEGGAGTLYVAPTASVSAEREMLTATTHSAAQYTMTFNVNGGQFSSSVESLTATLGCELPDCIPTPTRRGYLFEGWKTANSECYYEASGTKSISSYPVADDIVLYAQWHLDEDRAVLPDSAFWLRENAENGWFVDSVVGEDVILRSGQIGNSTNSWMETAIVGPASFSFDWKVSCNTRGHYLAWLVDGVEQERIRGEVDWTTVFASVSEGEHIIRLDYAKGSTSAAGEDKGQMRNFTINPVRIETESMQVLWDWTTNYWVSVSTTGFGSSGFESGWYADGSNVAVSIAPSIHSYSIALSGDTDGAVLDGTNLTFQVNGAARSITASIDEVKPHLSVVSEHGMPIPAVGDHIYSSDAEVTVSVEAPDAVDGVRAVCTGWTGTGSVPASGEGSSATFVITEDSSITWNWATAYWVECSIAGKGTTSFESQWVVDGTNLRIPFSVNTPFYSLSLAGDTDGAVLDDDCITVPVSSPRSIVLNVIEYTYSTALDSVSLPWIAEGAASWIPQGNVSHDGQDAVQSGKVVGDDVSTLSTVVVGPGTLSWWWKLDMADCAGVDVFVDETLVKSLDSASDWAAASVDIAGDGEHTIRFEFWNAGTEATMSDCAHLDQVFWTGEAVNHTVSTKVPVPHSYLAMNCPALLAEHGGDYEAAAKATAANGLNKVWECYVAGINPTDVAAKFTAKIEMKDGNPVITWEPNLNADGAAVRIYKVYGSETLENGGDWQSPTNSLHRFFKVGVEMP